MSTRMRSIIPMLGLALACVAVPSRANETVTRLIAGGGNPKSAIDVGRVIVTEADGKLCIRYEIDDADWCLTEVHLEVKTSLAEIPQARGNPIPGRFTYKADLDCADGWEQCIEITWREGTELFIAAHGVVEGGCKLAPVNPESPCPDLPEGIVNIVVQNPGLGFGMPSYFDLNLSNAGDLDGMYDAWCITTKRTIRTGKVYDGLMICTYDPEFQIADLVQYPGNIDLVNCLLNQELIGQPSSGGYGNYTFGDFQTAIWLLLEDDPVARGNMGSVDEDRVWELVAMAGDCGDDFVPGCDQFVGVVIVPVDEAGNISQPVIISLPVPCVPTDCTSETAWGEGPTFPGRNWFMYFNHTIVSDVDGTADVGDTTVPTAQPIKARTSTPSRVVVGKRGEGPPSVPARPMLMVR